MPFDAKRLANDLLNAAYNSGGSLTATLDIGDWPEEMVRETVDYILADRDTFKLRVKGIRTDTVGFSKFSIPTEDGNSGRYHGIPVVMAEVADFDTMQLVFEPQRR